MKKILTTLTLIFVLFFAAQATHNKGGEITVKQIAYLQYEATIHTYTKASSVPADRDSLEICWGDGNCEWVQRDTSYLYDDNRKYNIYSKQHSFAEEGNFNISMTDPNRNGAVLNFPFPDNIPLYIATTLLVSSLTNSTPILLNQFSEKAYRGLVYQHNPAAFDVDGDSLAYELIVPLAGFDTPVPNYTFPSGVLPGSNNQHELDGELGTFIWEAPQQLGAYGLAMKITEYRAGQILSTTIRDFEVTVRDSTMFAPPVIVTSVESVVTVEVGETLTFDIEGGESGMNRFLLRAFGGPFLLDNPATLDAPIDFQSGALNATFSWTITEQPNLISPYYLLLRMDERDDNEDGLTNYEVIKININGLETNTTSPKEAVGFEIFPNPVSMGLLFFKSKIPEGKSLNIKIFSLDGKILLEKNVTATANFQILDVQHLSEGNYFISLQSGEQMMTRLIRIE